NLDFSEEQSGSQSIDDLTNLIQFEHNYHVSLGPRDKLLTTSSTRKLVYAMQLKMNPGQPALSDVEISGHIRMAGLVRRRLRRFMGSSRTFLEFKPMSEMQEAIVMQLAQKVSCSTRFYKELSSNRRYMVVYRPGIKPNIYELQARDGKKGRHKKKASSDKEEKPEQQEDRHATTYFWNVRRQSLQSTRIHEHQLVGHSSLNACLLGRKILEKFNARR
ncbi:hypothetical protein KR018_000598, partial [Drosophila ironensis]